MQKQLIYHHNLIGHEINESLTFHPEDIMDREIFCRKLHSISEDGKVYSLGGATEASIWSIYYPIEEIDEKWASIPYGYPLANQTYYVLSDDFELCPIGVNGCLYIGGDGVADGYFKDENKTNNAFIETNTFGRLYKTGDYGIMSEAGYIIFMGREDSQVKVQGYRIELVEIEKHMRTYDGVSNAVVLHEKCEQNSSILIGYIVSDQQIDADEFIKYLESKLPTYMIPTQLYLVDEIPVSVNGKVDRKKLCQMKSIVLEKGLSKELGGEEQNLSKTEEELIEIWAELTGNHDMKVKDSFNSIGANSLVLISAFNKIRDRLYDQIRVADIFKYKNIRDLAGFIDANKEDEDDDDILF